MYIPLFVCAAIPFCLGCTLVELYTAWRIFQDRPSEMLSCTGEGMHRIMKDSFRSPYFQRLESVLSDSLSKRLRHRRRQSRNSRSVHGILCGTEESCARQCKSLGVSSYMMRRSCGLGCGGGKRCIGREACAVWQPGCKLKHGVDRVCRSLVVQIDLIGVAVEENSKGESESVWSMRSLPLSVC